LSCVQIVQLVSSQPADNGTFFFEFSCVLSRPCLGKSSVFTSYISIASQKRRRRLFSLGTEHVEGDCVLLAVELERRVVGKALRCRHADLVAQVNDLDRAHLTALVPDPSHINVYA
jgi:hypothetical protein